MKKLGQLFKYKLFWVVTAALFLLFVWPAKQLFWLFGFGDVDKIKSISDRLFYAMNRFGTDEEDMFLLLEPLSSVELRSVYREFGMKPYANGGRLVVLGSSFDLFGWFSQELTGKEKARMRDIWAKSGLEITF